MAEPNPQLEAIAERVSGLYSLPAVAMEVVQLTNQPNVDAAALARCIANDPALVIKVLRVVNSSLFGLSREVTDLNQALALLGTGPLKLLVLGFSLPEKLFAGARKDQLQWYWTTSLTRAVAARHLSQSLWNNSGDEAFLAGLLQDIGLLALLRELDEAFANFLGRVIAEQRDLVAAEVEALGFDHRQLTVAMLERWKLPELLVKSIAMTETPLRLARLEAPAAEIAKVLHLAELLAQLVGQRRINALPELLEAGNLYRGLVKPKLFDLVAELQPQVDQLAEVLSLELPADRDYYSVLQEAHEQLAAVAEDVAAPAARLAAVDTTCDEMLKEAQDLTAAMQAFLRSGSTAKQQPARPGDQAKDWSTQHGAHSPNHGANITATMQTVPITETDVLLCSIMSAARSCRMRRAELSLLLLEVDGYDHQVAVHGEEDARRLARACGAACRTEIPPNADLLRLSANQLAIVLPDCDRRQVVALANEIFQRISMMAEEATAPVGLARITISAGAATATSIFKNFSADKLADGAQRCLSAARHCGGSAVKSIEVL